MKKIGLFVSLLLLGGSSAFLLSCSEDEKKEEVFVPNKNFDGQMQFGDTTLSFVRATLLPDNASNDSLAIKHLCVQNDTLNVYVPLHSTTSIDSVTVKYCLLDNKLSVLVSECRLPDRYYLDVLSSYICRLQFVGDMSKNYELTTWDWSIVNSLTK